MFRKASIEISETMLLGFGIVITFLIMGSLGSMIFTGQAETADDAGIGSIAADISKTVDRVAAEAGSVGMIYTVPKGMKVDVEVAYKKITVKTEDSDYSSSLIALTHTRDYTLKNPKDICIVKNQDDMKIALSNDKCVCEVGDGRCDAACLLGPDCDTDCNMNNVQDNVCDKRCSKEGDRICDLDCFTNDKDMVNEATDCIKNLDDDGTTNYGGDSYKKSAEKDSICDGDSNMQEDGICDIDCLNNMTTMDGLCDIDCNKYDMTEVNGIMVSEDFTCDLDCTHWGDVPTDGSEIKNVILKKDGVCDLDCAGPVDETTGDWLDRTKNGICDPDCGGLYDKDCGNCAGLGEDCSATTCCGDWVGMDLVCCPGENICREDIEGQPACDGNGWCEIGPYSNAPDEDLEHQTIKWEAGSTHPKNWENAYNTEILSAEGYTDCSDAADGVCYSESQEYTTNEHAPSAYYYQADDGYSDPDCAGDGNGCQWINQASVGSNDNADCNGIVSGSQNADDDWCSITANDGCDPDCDISVSKRWDPDCGEPDCAAKVDMGEWTQSVYGSPDGSENYLWVPDAIEVCNEDVMAFLDRRGWDINQFAQSILAPAPDGWGFDYSRYATVDPYIQPASRTVNENEDYMAMTNACCPTDACYGTCAPAGTFVTDENCCGVGFCGDHSTAVTSILRTLGIPSNNIWSSFFKRKGGGHAWNVLYCNRSIENLGKYGNYNMYQNGFVLDDCVGRENQWIIIDATNHFIKPLSDETDGEFCRNMEDLWNDHGKYGFQGIVCDGREIDVTDENCQISEDGTTAICECSWCNSNSVTCQINHPLASTENCQVDTNENTANCPFRKNPQEAGNNMGC